MRRVFALVATLIAVVVVTWIGVERSTSEHVAQAPNFAVGAAHAAEVNSAEFEPNATLTTSSIDPARSVVGTERQLAAIRGVVVDAETNEPLAGVLVLRTPDVERVRSDERGEFEFAWNGLASAALSLPLQSGLATADERVAVPSEFDSRSRPIVLRARRVPTATFRGRIVYRATGQGVPFCTVRLTEVNRHVGESFVTDVDGRWSSKDPINLGLLELSVASKVVGVGEDVAEFEVRHESEAELVFAVDLPPTYLLDVAIPSKFSADELSVELSGCVHISRSNPLNGARLAWRPTQLDSQVADGADLTRGARLSIEHGSGLWRAECEVRSFVGVAQLAPIVEPCGIVRAHVIATNGRRPAGWIELIADHPTSRKCPTDSSSPLGWPGPFEVKCVPAGSYQVLAAADFCTRVEVPVVVLSGEVSEIEIELPCPPAVGSIRGVITSESGAFDGSIRATLTRNENPNRSWTADVQWSVETNERIGVFEFEHLPQLDDFSIDLYVADVVEIERAFAIDPPRISNLEPGDVAPFVVRDLGPRVDFGFVFANAMTKETIDDVRVTLDRRASSVRTVRSGEILARGVPDRGSFEWSLYKPGFQCVHGWFDDPDIVVTTNGATRLVHASLKPRELVRVDVFDEHLEPIFGATVHFDSIQVGFTDEDGWFELEVARAPLRVEASFDSRRAGEWNDDERRCVCDTHEIQITRH